MDKTPINMVVSNGQVFATLKREMSNITREITPISKLHKHTNTYLILWSV